MENNTCGVSKLLREIDREITTYSSFTIHENKYSITVADLHHSGIDDLMKVNKNGNIYGSIDAFHQLKEIYSLKQRKIHVLTGKHANRRGTFIKWKGTACTALFDGENKHEIISSRSIIEVVSPTSAYNVN